MELVKLIIQETTDKKYLNEVIETDTKIAILPSGEEIQFDGCNCYELPGTGGKHGYKLWNSNYIIIAMEV